MHPDFLIIGGGIIGLSIARELRRLSPAKITVLEKNVCGREASWAAAGMLSPQAEADASGAFFDLCCSGRDIYPDFVAHLESETGVATGFDQTGTICVSFDYPSWTKLLERYRWQRELGLAVESLDAEEILRREPYISSRVTTGLLFANDWQIDNRKLVTALAAYAEANDVEIREGVEATEVVVENGRTVGVRTSDETINAGTVILATGAWSSLIKLGTLETPIDVRPVRGQIVSFSPPQRLFVHVICGADGYLVPRHDGRILAGSTSEDVGFDRGVPDHAASELRRMAGEIAPDFRTMPIADHWSGFRPFAADGLPVLGPVSGIDNLMIATGHYRNGILLAPLTASLIAERLIKNIDIAEFRVLGPNRFRVAATQ